MKILLRRFFAVHSHPTGSFDAMPKSRNLARRRRLAAYDSGSARSLAGVPLGIYVRASGVTRIGGKSHRFGSGAFFGKPLAATEKALARTEEDGNRDLATEEETSAANVSGSGSPNDYVACTVSVSNVIRTENQAGKRPSSTQFHLPTSRSDKSRIWPLFTFRIFRESRKRPTKSVKFFLHGKKFQPIDAWNEVYLVRPLVKRIASVTRVQERAFCDPGDGGGKGASLGFVYGTTAAASDFLPGCLRTMQRMVDLEKHRLRGGSSAAAGTALLFSRSVIFPLGLRRLKVYVSPSTPFAGAHPIPETVLQLKLLAWQTIRASSTRSSSFTCRCNR